MSATNLAAERLPHGSADLDSFMRLWERESVLSGAGLLHGIVVDANCLMS